MGRSRKPLNAQAFQGFKSLTLRHSQPYGALGSSHSEQVATSADFGASQEALAMKMAMIGPSFRYGRLHGRFDASTVTR